VFALPKRDQFQVWTVGPVADVIGDPGRFRAPYVDARIVKTDRRLKHEESLNWREYRLTAYHLPGQTVFAMGVEVEVDGKKCFFTGDNVYHVDQYSGSGGWSGFNRGLPGGYARSAQRILDGRPDWVLAEHGGAFEFNAEDFRRRVRWAEKAAAAADALSPSGNHGHDWDPHRIQVEPFLIAGIPGRTVKVQLVVANPTTHERTLTIVSTRPDVVVGREVEITVPANAQKRQEIEWNVNGKLKKGRYVVPLVAREGDTQDAADTIFVLEVE
jgi:glyoxylase-like metal-dependent hydrolase (beta-lactamase superfamily II)